MNITPMYILACVFFIISGALFILWQFLAAILARLLPPDDIEFGGSWQDDLRPFDYLSVSSNTAAPAHIIHKLPVFVFGEQQQQREDEEQEQEQEQEEEAVGQKQQEQQRAKELVASNSSIDQNSSRCSGSVCINSSSAASDGMMPAAQAPLAAVASTQHTLPHQACHRSSPASQQQQHEQQQCQDLQPGGLPAQQEHVVAAAAATAAATPHTCSPCSSNQQLPTTIGSSSSSSSCSSNVHHSSFAAKGTGRSSDGRTAGSRAAGGTGSSSGCNDVLQDGQLSCVICFGEYNEGDLIKQLPCQHCYHAPCIDAWLMRCATCPLCKQSVWRPPTPFFIPC